MTVLNAENISKKYIAKTVLEHLSLTLEEGKIYGLLGPNAAGKTTFMKIIAGLTQPTAGSIKIDGEHIGVHTKKKVSYMPTTNCLPGWMKIKQCIGFYRDMYDDFDTARAGQLIEFMGLKPEQKVSTLSTGLLGRLKLTLALSRKAKLYVFDEPLNGIDPISLEKIIKVIIETSSEGNTFLISSHLINELENILDEVIFLDKGRVALKGNAEDIRAEKGKSMIELYREVYGDV